jgi:hypothetical protein
VFPSYISNLIFSSIILFNLEALYSMLLPSLFQPADSSSPLHLLFSICKSLSRLLQTHIFMPYSYKERLLVKLSILNLTFPWFVLVFTLK